jgi:LmbE family N-acetylglucosaminyl deacetylase
VDGGKEKTVNQGAIMGIFDGYKNLLVFAAHPDDEILGAGGTIARLSESGVRVFVAFVATGGTSRADVRQGKADAVVESLREQARKAHEIVGVQEGFFLGYEDQKLDILSRHDVSVRMKELVNRLQPQMVFTHHPHDYNWDHSFVFDCTMMCCRPNAGDFFPHLLLSYEVPSATERAFRTPATAFCPNIFVDIEKFLFRKQEAMRAYVSEVRPYPHPRSATGLDLWAGQRGLETGVARAECFQLIRHLY